MQTNFPFSASSSTINLGYLYSPEDKCAHAAEMLYRDLSVSQTENASNDQTLLLILNLMRGERGGFESTWIHRNRAVPSAHAIKTWVRNFEATGSTLKKKGGSVKTVRTPENIVVTFIISVYSVE
jgi:hypothetical protein